MQETWVQSLGWEDPLGEGNGLPTPVFWPGEFHGQRSLVGYMGLQRVRHDRATFTSLHLQTLISPFLENLLKENL